MVYSTIQHKINKGHKQLVVLIDPESVDNLDELLALLTGDNVDMFFVGGSTGGQSSAEVLSRIRSHSDKDVVLFPGNVSQLTSGVDAVLFLSLLSGRNPEYLIENHVKAAPLLKGMEVIPVAYLLVDGGRVSTTQRITQTQPLSDVKTIVDTALAGQYMGNKMIYLEAGSGASFPVTAEIIRAVKSVVHIPLIVGGGIRSRAALDEAYASGADIVVVGNALEHDPYLLNDF